MHGSWLIRNRISWGLVLIVVVGMTRATKVEGDEVVSMLVDSVQLAGQLESDALRILDVRAEADYQRAHLPGAVHVAVGRWKELAASDGGFTNQDAWKELVSSYGISNDTTVVIYGGKLSDAARVWWLLKYVGLERVQLLDGGWEHWKQENRPTDAATPDIVAGNFIPRFQTDRLAELPDVKSLLENGKATMLDTRSDREFNAGRIPGSVHLEWSQLLADDGRFKSVDELKSLFGKMGIAIADTAVCY